MLCINHGKTNIHRYVPYEDIYKNLGLIKPTLPKAQGLSSFTKVIAFKSPQKLVSFKISTKIHPKNLDQISASTSRPNLRLNTLTKIQLQNLDRTSAIIDWMELTPSQ